MDYKLVKSKPNYVSYRIPANWNVENLGKICNFQRGLSYSSSDLDEKDGNYLINLLCFKIGGGFKKHGLKFYQGKENETAQLAVNDLIIAITEVTLKAEIIGFPLLVPFLNKKKIFHTMDTCKLSPKIKILKEQLYYFLCTQICHKSMHAFSTTTTVMHLNLNSVKKIQVPIPSSREQQQITSILSKVDALISSYDDIIQRTKVLKKGLLQKLLTKGIRHTKFQKQKFCFSFLTEMFPTSWKNVRIKDIAHIVRGGSPRPAGDSKYFGGSIPWITVGELTKDDFMFLNSTENGLTDLGKKYSRFLDQGTVVISNSGYTLGHPKILNISGCANDGIAAFIELDEVIDPKFLYYSLKQWTKHLRNVNQGVFQVNLNTEILGNLYLPLPKIEEQHKIVTILSDYDSYIKELESKFVFLSLLKKGLMQKLLTGQIRV